MTIHKLNTTQKKQVMQNTAKQNYPGSVAYYNTRPGNEVGLFYNASKPTRGEQLTVWSIYAHQLPVTR